MMELNTYIGDIMDDKEKNMGDIVRIMDNMDNKKKKIRDIVKNMETGTDWRHNNGVSTASEAAIVVGSIRKQLNSSRFVQTWKILKLIFTFLWS